MTQIQLNLLTLSGITAPLQDLDQQDETFFLNFAFLSFKPFLDSESILVANTEYSDPSFILVDRLFTAPHPAISYKYHIRCTFPTKGTIQAAPSHIPCRTFHHRTPARWPPNSSWDDHHHFGLLCFFVDMSMMTMMMFWMIRQQQLALYSCRRAAPYRGWRSCLSGCCHLFAPDMISYVML